MKPRNKKILVIEDDPFISDVYTLKLESEGYQVDAAENGTVGLEKVKKNKYDAILLDIVMPELDGFSACREIFKFKRLPVLMLSARGEEYDKIHGFELGIDDYVVKPFSPKEVMLRLEVLIRRNQKPDHPSLEHEVLVFAGLSIDFTGRIVTIDGNPVDLSPKEYELLFYLVRNRGIALTREKLISEVWGYDFFGDDRTLDTHIKLLRNSLGDYRRFIVTLRGVGYRFEA